jgi:CRP-like cAMP-binding protein
VGDWIQVDATRQGRVRSINWRHTVLETREGDSIIMPNSVMLSTPFTILARRDGSPYLHRQTVYFRVDYRFAPSRVCSTVTNALRSTTIANVSGEPAADCVCVDLGRETLQSTALYAARYWILDLTTDGPTDSEVRCRVHASLRREGIPLALPASTVFNASLDHLSGDAQRERRRLRAFQAVRGVELFRSLTDDECQRLASTLTFCPFTAGEIITRQGATAHYLYLLAAGKVEVRIRADDAERAVATIDAPGFFGEMGLLTGAARQASVYALVPCDCFKLDAGAFQTVIRERPEVAGGVAERLARRQVELGVAQQDLGAHAAAAREKNESARLTERIREFFGLEE